MNVMRGQMGRWPGAAGRGKRLAAPTFAAMVLLSANGTLRTILILLIIWQLLRLWMRMQRPGQPHNTGRQGPEERRPRGDVRIERLKETHHSPVPPDVEDAEFEEIK